MSLEVWYRVDRARILSIILLCMLLVPAVSADMLTLEVLADGEPVVWANPARYFNAVLRFTTDWQEGIITLDLSALSAGSKSINLNTCEHDTTTTCQITGLRLSADAAVTIPYTYAMSGAQRTGEYRLSFQVDESTPHVVSLTTEVCDDQRCYIGDGKPAIITLELADETGAFEQRNVYWRLGSETFRADECNGMTCTGATTMSCSDRQSLRLEATAETKDDAGNPAALGNMTSVVCDARPPESLALSYNGTGTFGLVTDAGSLLVHATVRDTTGVHITAYTYALQQNVSENTTMRASCQQNGTMHDCLLEIGNLQAGQNKRLILMFEDLVGNAYNKTLVIPHILKVANTSVVPDFFSVKADNTVPESVNRVALQLALDNAIEYPQYISYTITRKNPQARILYQEAESGSCQVLNGPAAGDPFNAVEGNWTAARALYNSFSVYDPYASWEEPNRVDATFLSLDDEAFHEDVIRVRCNLSFAVIVDNTLYENPELETLYWPVRLRNSRLGTPGTAFLEKIDEAEGKVNGPLNQLIGTATTLVNTMNQICQLEPIILMIQSGDVSMEGVGWLLVSSGFGSVAGEGIIQNTVAGFLAQSQTNKPLWPGEGGDATENGFGGTFRKFCNFVHCKTDEALSEGGSWMPGGDAVTGTGDWSEAVKFDDGKGGAFGAGWNDYMSDMNQPNVEDSLIMSLATQCLSGVVYNLNKYRQIDCGYLVCLREQASQGASVVPCEESKGTQMCLFIANEVFEMPYLRVFKNLMGNINQIIQNPLSLVVKILDKGPCAKADPEQTLKGFACRVVKTLGIQKDFRSVTSGKQFFTSSLSNDLCERATCTGEECDYPYDSYLNSVAPDFGMTGDQWREVKIRENEVEKVRRQNGAAAEAIDKYYDDLKEYERVSAMLPANSDPPTITPAMTQYFNENVKGRTDKDGNKYDSPEEFYSEAATKCGGTPGENCLLDLAYNVAQGNTPSTPQDMKNLADFPTSALVSYGSFHALDKLKCDGVCTENSLKSCIERPDGNRCKSEKSFVKTTTAELNKQGYVMQDVDGKMRLCSKDNNDDCYTDAQMDQLNTERKKAQRKAAGTALVDSFIDVGLGYLIEQGYADAIMLKGWNPEMAAKIDNYLNPDKWKENLCNPNGAYKEFTQEVGSVYAFQDGTYRPVLTFAGEVLELDGSYLYTASGVALSLEGDNQVNLTLMPGHVPIGSAELPENEFGSPQGSYNSTILYEHVCAEFREPFPNPAGSRQYCRPLEQDAYGRGTWTNATLPEYGTDDPYNKNTSSSVGGNQLWGLMGGMMGGMTG